MRVQGQIKEQRIARRYALCLQVAIHVQNKTPLLGMSRDISTRGVYFTIDQELSVDAEFDTTLRVPVEVTGGSEVFIRALIRVVRIDKKPDDGPSRVGVAAVIKHYEILLSEQPTL